MIGCCGLNAPVRNTERSTPLQKPKYKLDENLDYIEEICKAPPDYYDKCSSKPCTKCSSAEKCTDPPKTKIDFTRCGYKKHYIAEPSPHSFEGDPLYGWTTKGAKGPNDEGPFSVVTMQPYGYPQAAAIVLLNDAEPQKPLPTPTPLSTGLQKLNKFPNKRGVLLPDCPFRKNQSECSTIGCPEYVTPGTFNPETGRYTPKRYFPPHFHKMHGFLNDIATASDPGYTFESCFTYPPDMDYETQMRDIFGFCQEGPCGQVSRRQEVGKCQYIDCPAKERVDTETEQDDRYKLTIPGESDIRPGHVIIEHGISRQVCCFDDSISSFGGESVFSESAVSETSEGTEKERMRISRHGEMPGEDFEPDRHEYFKSMLSSIDFDSFMRPKAEEAPTRTPDGYVPHRRCTWRDGEEVVDAELRDHEARTSARGILDDIFERRITEPVVEYPERFEDPHESHRISVGILDGIVSLGGKIENENEFESHEPDVTEKRGSGKRS